MLVVAFMDGESVLSTEYSVLLSCCQETENSTMAVLGCFVARLLIRNIPERRQQRSLGERQWNW